MVEGRHDGNRIYSATTKDFRTFTKPEIFYDPGYMVIDATTHTTRPGRFGDKAFHSSLVEFVAEAFGHDFAISNPLSPVETMELLLDKLSKTRGNAEFLAAMSG